MHRLQAGKAGLDHPASGLWNLHQAVVGTDLEEACDCRVQGVTPFGHQADDRLLELSQRPAHLTFDQPSAQRPDHHQQHQSGNPLRGLQKQRGHQKELVHQAKAVLHLLLPLPFSHHLRLREGGRFAAGNEQGHAIQCGIPLHRHVVHALAPFQGRGGSGGMVHHRNGEVFLRRSLLEGLPLHPPGDDLRRLVILLVDQALQALQFRLDGLHVAVTSGRLPARQGARMHLQVPHRPVPGGVVGIGDRDGVPQPPGEGPLCWKLGGLPRGHLRQRVPGVPRFQHVPQGLAVMVLEGYGTDGAQMQT